MTDNIKLPQITNFSLIRPFIYKYLLLVAMGIGILKTTIHPPDAIPSLFLDSSKCITISTRVPLILRIGWMYSLSLVGGRIRQDGAVGISV